MYFCIFIDIQQQGQLSLFNQNLENEFINEKEIRDKMASFLKNFPQGIMADRLLASFYTTYGVLCKSGVIKNIWKSMEDDKEILVERVPSVTAGGTRPSRTFTESKNQRVTIWRSKS